MGRGLNTSSLLFLIVVMKIEVYIRRYNEVMLCSDGFSVESCLLNLFIKGGWRRSQADYLFNSNFTFKPLRIYRITPYFQIETGTIDILNFQDLRLENIYSDIVSVQFDILNTRFLQSNELPKYKSISGFVKMRAIEVSQEEFKKFLLKVIDKVFMSCFFHLEKQSQFKRLYILRTWLYSYFPDIGSISYIEYNLRKLFNEII